jgi:hypothetical protein
MPHGLGGIERLLHLPKGVLAAAATVGLDEHAEEAKIERDLGAQP